VERGRNPAHRRSALVALTPEGTRAMERMQRREQALLSGTDFGLGPAQLQAAARTLRRLRAALGGAA